MIDENGGSRRYRISADIGGTFTDLVLQDPEDGRLAVAKVPSTPADPSEGALHGIETITAEAGIGLDEVAEITHATTHGANIIIEQKGARTALLTTAGFGDILLIQRQLRYSPYDVTLERHRPLVERDLVFEVPERLRFDGSVYRELDEEEVARIAERLRELEVEAVAICLLHSYANDAHERRVAEIIAATLPDLSLSLSCEAAPLIREYERASTTVADAYIRPAFRTYLGRLESALAERGFGGSLFVTQANGGLASVELTMDAPIRAVESGPAGAVTMAGSFAVTHDLDRVLVFDMGGTTAKAGLIAGGEAPMVDTFEIDKKLLRLGTGLPLRIPSVDIIEIGAGGGSIARAALGVVEVGPESSGADPGPACYQRGGTRATVSDANLILGYLNPDFFNGGAMGLSVERAEAAVRADIGEPLGLEVPEAAWGIHETVTANMEHAIRTVSTDRGEDPRELTLVASGGAGPLHAARLARNLGMRKVMVPAFAGVMSALGLLQSNPRFDLAESVGADLAESSAADFERRFGGLEEGARKRLGALGLGDAEATLERRIDAQFRGQGHTVEVPISSGALDRAAIEASTARFHERYVELYGQSDPTALIEVTAVRLVATVARPGITLPESGRAGGATAPTARRAYFPEAEGFTETAVYRRSELGAGDSFAGPALIEDAESTVVVPPGDLVTIDPARHVMIEINPGAGESEEA